MGLITKKKASRASKKSKQCSEPRIIKKLLSIKKKSSYSGDVLSEKTQSAMGESNQTRKKKSRTSPECLAATTDPKDKESEAFKAMGKAMTHNIWYHGLMPRDEVEDLLRRDGDFVVRKTEFLGKPKFTLSVSNKQRIRHILFKCENNEWFFRDIRRSTPSELIEAHLTMRAPVQSDGTILERGIPRPEFYILHEHIEIIKKLGGGAFGEVYTGIWKKKDGTVEVAVKTLKGIMHKKQRAEFMKEAKLMKRFDHKNIVRLYGVAPQEEPIMIILEYAAGGSLKVLAAGLPLL